MSSLLAEGDLTYEEHVVWLEDPEHLDYVRQALEKDPGPQHHAPTRVMAA
ncbi:DUF6009 family protein [Streptomyces sp. NPDC088350]